MIKFPAQFHGYKKLTLGDTIISFSVDQMFAKETLELAGEDIGTQYIVWLEPVTPETNLNADHKDIDDRFRGKMHALINELATWSGKEATEVKDDLREVLKDKKLIQSSTTELDIKGLAIACNILEKWIEQKKK